jgi:hypothetical protein
VVDCSCNLRSSCRIGRGMTLAVCKAKLSQAAQPLLASWHFEPWSPLRTHRWLIEQGLRAPPSSLPRIPQPLSRQLALEHAVFELGLFIRLRIDDGSCGTSSLAYAVSIRQWMALTAYLDFKSRQTSLYSPHPHFRRPGQTRLSAR